MPPTDSDVKSLITKALTGLVSVCTAVSLGLATFTLKECVAAQLAIRELSVRMLAVETAVEQARQQQVSLSEGVFAIKLSDQRLGRVEQDVAEIKTDLRVLVQRK